jgi:hypothetical protein
MEILDRVAINPNICGVELAFMGEITAANIPEWQPFFNSTMFAVDFAKTYVGLGSVSFGEESEYSLAGTSYKQSVTIRFPVNDENRSQRIELMQNVKFVKLILTDGREMLIGRNDYKQNARPKIKTKTNIKTAEAEFQTISMFSAGFVSDVNSVGVPTLIPISLYL